MFSSTDDAEYHAADSFFLYSVRALIALPINEVFRDYSIYFYTLHYEWLLTRHRRTVAAFAELARRGPETGLQCIKL